MATPDPTAPTTGTTGAGFDTFLGKVQMQILDPIITLIALGAFILFAFGVVEFLRGGADSEKRTTGQQHMIWGIVGLTIIFGAKTIIEILKKIVGA